MTVGTGGVGFVLYSPSLANDRAATWYSDATFAGTAASVSTSAVNVPIETGANAGFNNAPYTVSQFDASQGADFANGVKGRMVSAAMSMQCTAPISNVGGTYYLYSDPWHGNQNGATASSLGAKAECQIGRVTTRKIWTVTCATDMGEQQYATASAFTSTSSTGAVLAETYPFSDTNYFYSASFGNGAAPIVLVVTGAAGLTFEIETVAHVEYIGGVTQALLTPSHADPVGAEAVNAAAQKLPLRMAAQPNVPPKKSMMQDLGEALGELTGSAASAFADNIRRSQSMPFIDYSMRNGRDNPYLRVGN